MMRVDKWLWTARLFKTRSLAAQAVRGGRVHINGTAVKPGREIRPGDELEVTVGHLRRTVIVLGAAERRVSAPEVAHLYRETEGSLAAREREAALRRLGGPPEPGGRPTKRDRRRFDADRHRRSWLVGEWAGDISEPRGGTAGGSGGPGDEGEAPRAR